MKEKGFRQFSPSSVAFVYEDYYAGVDNYGFDHQDEYPGFH